MIKAYEDHDSKHCIIIDGTKSQQIFFGENDSSYCPDLQNMGCAQNGDIPRKAWMMLTILIKFLVNKTHLSPFSQN